MDKIIKSPEFRKEIPENIRDSFVNSLLAEPEFKDKYTFEEMQTSFPVSEDCPMFLVSKEVQRAASQINPEKVREIFDLGDLPFTRAVICLGSDVDGMYYLQIHTVVQVFLSFTFLSGSTDKEIMKYRQLGNIVSSPIQFLHSKEQTLEFKCTMLLLQILIYMHYGDIITKKYGKKDKIVTNTRGTITNTTDYEITYVNTLWKQRVSTVGFPVVGHWRLQPYGPRDAAKHKLLWIEEFEKSGYNRKATKESKYNN